MKSLTTMLKKTMRSISKINIWIRLFTFLGVLFLILNYVNYNHRGPEGFAQMEKFKVMKNDNLYDDFYCGIYDDLVHDWTKNDYEVRELSRILKPSKNKTLVDMGCGRGHHVNLFNKKGFNASGLDISPAMIEKAKKKYPKSEFKKGNALDAVTYKQSSIDVISCLYFTIYYIQEKKTFIDNCYNWLKPGGHFVLHLVNRDKFDPIINSADPLHIVSAQKYAKKRITNSLVKFKDFQYKGNFEFDKPNNKAEFVETFKDDSTGNVRKNVHTLHMETQKKILALAKQTGFILKGKIDLTKTMYEYQYLYILYKPE